MLADPAASFRQAIVAALHGGGQQLGQPAPGSPYQAASFNEPGQQNVLQQPMREPARTPDAQNPAAVAYANQRIQQLIRAGLLAAAPTGGDPTAIWRGLSATLTHPAQQAGYGSNGGAFLRAAADGVDGEVGPLTRGLNGPVIQQSPIQRAVHAARQIMVDRLAHTYLGRH